MGGQFSCLSKAKSAKHAKQAKNKNGHITAPSPDNKNNNQNNCDAAALETAIKPVQNGGGASHLTSAAPPATVEETKIEFLPQAPSNFKAPQALFSYEKLLKQQQQPGEAPAALSSGRSHQCQQAEMHAYQLARQSQRPQSWRDLYYHLIGQPGLKSERDIARALFTWLCSIPPTTSVFVTGSGDRPKKLDTPERMIEALVEGRATYFQAFQLLCNHAGLDCQVVRGIAKGVAYEVGQQLTLEEGASLFDSQTEKLHAKVAHLGHAWNACKIDGQWRLFDPSWAARRLSVNEQSANQAAQAVLSQYQQDMFYFMTDPAKLFYTHYPISEAWQLLPKAGSLKKFQNSVLLKPSFFRYGLGLYSHPEGYIPVKNELTLKLFLPEEDPGKLLFTYNLTLEGLGQIYQGKNLSTYGIHTISLREKMVTFMFRLPKRGMYKLLIYARKSGETMFADVCEYKIHALFDMDSDEQQQQQQQQPTEGALPFPPCGQSSYGPTEKALALGIHIQPINMDPLISSQTGIVEIRFIQSDPEQPLPRLAARLKSIHSKDAEFDDCILYRQVQASYQQGTNASTIWSTNSAQITTGPGIPMNVITVYMPRIAEFALEIFAKKPATSETEEETDEPYHLVWQLLIDSKNCWPLEKHTQDRLAMLELGPRKEWFDLGMKAISHHDPMIRVPTVARFGANIVQNRARSEREIISKFASSHASVNSGSFGAGNKPSCYGVGEDSNMGSQITVIDKSMEARDSSDEAKSDVLSSPGTQKIYNESLQILSPIQEIKSRDHDIQVVIEVPDSRGILLMAQMVDISANEQQEEDVTQYILKEVEPRDDDEDELNGGLSESSMRNLTGDRINYLVRIPKGGHFYKLFFYACPIDQKPEEQIPLLYTYLIEAPIRLTSSETPYIGSLAGPFPEKHSNVISLRT